MLSTTMPTPKKPARPARKKSATATQGRRAQGTETGGRRKSALTRIGDEAKRDAMRKALLKSLRENDWNLTVTAEAMEMASNVSVIQALQDLAPEEYEAAKADGRISPGKRRG